MFKRETEICIDGQMVDCKYEVKHREIIKLEVVINNELLEMTELLHLPWVYESLEAHHLNLLEEENCES